MKNHICLFSIYIIFLLCIKHTNAQEIDSLISKGLFELSLYELMNVEIISATKTGQKVHEAPAIVTVISSEQIENSGATTLAELLQNVPGINIQMNYAYPYMTIRGVASSPNTRTLLMIDGYSDNSLTYGTHHIDERITLSMIKQIEIIRGPGSALYGSDAFLGIINIITKTGKDLNGASVSVSYGSFNTKKASILIGQSLKEKNIDFLIAVDGYMSDGPNLFIPKDAHNFFKPLGYIEFNSLSGYTENNSSDLRNIYSKISYKDFTLTVKKHRFIKEEPLNDMYLLTDNQKVFENKEKYILTYTNQLSEKFKIQGDIYYNAWDYLWYPYDLGNKNAWSALNDDTHNYSDWEAYPKVFEKKAGAKLMTQFQLLKNNFFILGIEYCHENVYDANASANSDWPDYSNWTGNSYAWAGATEYPWLSEYGHEGNNWSIYLQDEITLFSKFNITLGTRYDIHDTYKSVFTPRFGIVYKPLKNTSVKLLYGSAYKAPSYLRLYTINNPSNWGNEDLKPEKIQTLELAIDTRFLKYYNIRINGFQNISEDLIMANADNKHDDPALGEIPMFDNILYSKIYGIEAEIKVQINKSFSGFVNYSYVVPVLEKTSDAFLTVDKKYLSQISNHLANAGFNYSFLKYFNINTTINYTGKIITKQKIPGDKIDVVIDPYTIVNMNLRVFNLIKGVEASFKINNLFNTKYYNSSRFFNIPRPGRNCMCNLKYSF